MLKTLIYDWGGFNVWLFHALNDVHNPVLDALMELGTTLGDHGNFALYVSFVAVMAYRSSNRANLYISDGPHQFRQTFPWIEVMAVFTVAYVLDGWLISWLKTYLNFPRPLLALPAHSVITVGVPQLHHSLPSGHASFAMLIAASLWPILGRQYRLTIALFVLWVGISRVYLGAHFPADVVVGWLSCLLLVLLVRRSLAWMFSLFPTH